MARSIEFNSTDMADHKLIVTTPGFNLLRQLVGRVQLQDRGYAFTPTREPRPIVLAFAVTGTSLANLDVNLDAIKKVLTLTEPKKLIFDSLPLRYYNAILENFVGEYVHGTLFRGTLSFICPDPLGYKTVPDNHNHDINLAIKTITEVVAGTGYAAPVWTLIPQNDLTGATIKLENITTEEELQWGPGDLDIDEELVIDVAHWLVTVGGDPSMGTVIGKFPRLKPGVSNSIKVTGLKDTDDGNLNILYRDTYL